MSIAAIFNNKLRAFPCRQHCNVIFNVHYKGPRIRPYHSRAERRCMECRRRHGRSCRYAKRYGSVVHQSANIGLWVLSFYMTSKIHFPLKGFPADITSERFESRVLACVGDEVRRLAEGFAAMSANIRLFTWKQKCCNA